LFNHLPVIHTGELFVGVVTLASLIIWPKFKTPIPTYLPAAIIGTLAAFVWGFDDIETIGTRFHYLLPDGTSGAGIPPVLPSLTFPWQQPGPHGVPLHWNLSLVIELLPAAFSIAMLGAIESLLCAVVLDGMSQKRHHSNGELLGQGIGNLVTPWFGGITATAALARSATNYRVGAVSPIAAIIHSLVVLLAILLLAPWLAKIPMATMAAMLLMVAWNMSEAPKAIKLIRQANLGDVLVLLSCFSLTVIFDMVIAICAGVVLAALLFMRDIAQMTQVKDISGVRKHVPVPLPDGTAVYKVSGPLFFAAADRVFDHLEHLSQEKQKIILYLDGVSILDAGGLSALERFIERRIQDGCEIVLADL
jgi:SulP family sulfate permease